MAKEEIKIKRKYDNNWVITLYEIIWPSGLQGVSPLDISIHLKDRNFEKEGEETCMSIKGLSNEMGWGERKRRPFKQMMAL